MSLYADEVYNEGIYNERNEYINATHNEFANKPKAEASVESEINSQSHNDIKSNTNTKVNAEPAYAPSQSFDVSNQTCLAGVGGSLGVGGVFSGGYAGTHEDEQCTYRANLNHITALYGREVGRAYAKKYLVGLDKILIDSGEEPAQPGVDPGDNVGSINPMFIGSRM